MILLMPQLLIRRNYPMRRSFLTTIATTCIIVIMSLLQIRLRKQNILYGLQMPLPLLISFGLVMIIKQPEPHFGIWEVKIHVFGIFMEGTLVLRL